MFVALDKNNQRVTLTSHDQAANLTHQTFHCPICKQVVRIKNGTVMPAHFAHRSNWQMVVGILAQTAWRTGNVGIL